MEHAARRRGEVGTARGGEPEGPACCPGETVLWGPFGAEGFVSGGHVTPAPSPGRASRDGGHVCPQGRGFAGLALGGDAAQPWDHPAGAAGSAKP